MPVSRRSPDIWPWFFPASLPSQPCQARAANPNIGKCHGGVAQRLEQRLHKPRVGGSIPPAAIFLLAEGLDDARWVLMDYGDFIVHVFLGEARQFYDLEHLWGDAPRWDWDEREGELVGAAT